MIRQAMKSDYQLRKEIQDALKWDTSMDANTVTVTVRDGIVTLAGHLRSHAERCAAEQAVEQVAGVQALLIETDVRLTPHSQRTDTEIARAVLSALESNPMVPRSMLHIQVEGGWVTLNGELERSYQRQAAERALRDLTGVMGVSNLIKLRPKEAAEKTKQVNDKGACAPNQGRK